MSGAELAFAIAIVRLATPLALAALGELLAERSGVLNIGIEGMMLAGAFAAYAVAIGSGSALAGIAASALAGVALAALFALFAISLRADPIVCGTALNLLALGLTGSAYRLLYPPGKALPSAPRAGDWLGIDTFLWLTAFSAVVLVLLAARTRAGLAIRAAGEGAAAAHAQGVPVLGLRWACTLGGGAFAGVAGASLVLWISDRFVENMTSGRGFIALALVLFGGYSVPRILAGAGLFGFASALQFRLQAAGLAIPYNLLLMLPYVLTLAVLAFATGRARAPADLGRPFPQE
jgi:general nucleoside transport system permease protein